MKRERTERGSNPDIPELGRRRCHSGGWVWKIRSAGNVVRYLTSRYVYLAIEAGQGVIAPFLNACE
eukprot:13995922-Alexandrium_andersonii.AAC.1